MATTLVVERIDIIEGPNLDELLRALKHAVPRPDGLPKGINVEFKEVVFFGRAEGDLEVRQLAELGYLFAPKLVGIRYLGNDANPATRDDFVITLKSWTTFEGHYNAHSRKGSVIAIK
jgi:hypothetical protein